MRENYKLWISGITREVTTAISHEYHYIFRVDTAIQKKLEDVFDDEIFNIGKKVLGLEKFRGKNPFPKADHSIEYELAFKNYNFINKGHGAPDCFTWLRINFTHGKVEVEPAFTHHSDERDISSAEYVAYANMILSPIVSYLETSYNHPNK